MGSRMKKHPTDRLTQRVSTHLTGAKDAALSRHLARVGKTRPDWLREAIGEKMEREGTHEQFVLVRPWTSELGAKESPFTFKG